MRLLIIGLFLTVIFLLALLYPTTRTGGRTSALGPAGSSSVRCLVYDSSTLQIGGAELAERQIGRGLRKPIERDTERDQSFEGLRDIIAQSEDPGIKKQLRMVEELEDSQFDRSASAEPVYRDGLFEDFSPLAVFIQEKTGLPASVVMAQLAVESGWASSNVTILKNNVMGLGNCRAPETFTATLDLDGFKKEIPVTCMLDTTAYKFENVADSIFYYAYVLLQSEDNEPQYGPLRHFIRENRDRLRFSPAQYRERVVALLAGGYHADPSWYRNYISPLVEELSYLDSIVLCK